MCIRDSHLITNSLKDKDIDIILFTDPRYFNKGVAFGSIEILFYLLFRNKNAIVIHRINECDQRKKTKHMNMFLRWSNYCADHTIFISNWLKSLNLYQLFLNSIVFSLNLTSSPMLILNVLSLLRAAFSEIEIINIAKPICAKALP